MSTISTHVLDTALGRPAAGIGVTLERLDDAGAAVTLGSGATDSDGRLRDLVPSGHSLVVEGTYRLRFAVDDYFARTGRDAFYPEVSISFRVGPTDEHYHVPVLLSPFGYSTYRGS
jgi:5-hydroxyisourate hydrolase